MTDVGNHRLYRFSLAGYLISSQPIPVANSMDSAHLAVDAAGDLYMTEPEAGRVVRLDANGTIDRIWSVRTENTADAKPVGIAVAADGTIWVADSQGGRLLRLTPEAGE
jgi:sugar lactone lactonase YvrE